MITKVRLKNWRSHLDSEFNFSEGTNVLVGILGSGKTSVLDAICFALFGKFPALQAKKLKLDDIIMKKPVKKDQAEVEVVFQIDGSVYSVKRAIEKGKGTRYSEFREDGKLVESPSIERVTELVEKTIKVNYELFSKAIYSEQNGLDYFLTLQKGQRMRKIDQLLMIDKFESARASAVTVRNKIVDMKLGKQSIVEQTDIEALQAAVAELEKSLNAMSEDVRQQQERFASVEEKKSATEREVKELEEIHDSIESLKREERGTESAINEISVWLRNSEEILKEKKPEEIETRLLELSAALENLESEFKEKRERQIEMSKKLSESKARLEFFQSKEIKRLQKDLKEKQTFAQELKKIRDEHGEDVKAKLHGQKEVYEKVTGQIQIVGERINQLERAVKELSEAETKCPVCDAKLTGEKKQKLMADRQAQIEQLNAQVEDLKKQKEVDRVEVENLERILSGYSMIMEKIKDFDVVKTEFEQCQKTVQQLSGTVEESENKLAEFRKDLERVEAELKTMRDEKKTVDMIASKIEEYQKNKARIEDLELKKKGIESQLERMKEQIGKRNLEDGRKELETLIIAEGRLKGDMACLLQSMKEKRERLEEQKEKIMVVQEQKSEIEKLEKIAKDLNIFERALEETQIQLRRGFVVAVNYTMDKLWSTLYPYRDFVSIGLGIDEGDYVLQLHERTGDWVNVEGVASGGERSIACLALRIAFALVLAPNLRFLILDEPTANLDAEAITELANTLRERIGEFIEQTFLITHEEELKEAATGICYKLKRDKKIDGTTEIELIT